MGLIGEAFIVVFGICFILFSFIKNTYHHGFLFAKLRARIHLEGVEILLTSFVDVFVKGKTEKEILDQ